eukprot:11830432-Alexandrium_andersonii.AAC.1
MRKASASRALVGARALPTPSQRASRTSSRLDPKARWVVSLPSPGISFRPRTLMHGLARVVSMTLLQSSCTCVGDRSCLCPCT